MKAYDSSNSAAEFEAIVGKLRWFIERLLLSLVP